MASSASASALATAAACTSSTACLARTKCSSAINTLTPRLRSSSKRYLAVAGVMSRTSLGLPEISTVRSNVSSSESSGGIGSCGSSARSLSLRTSVCRLVSFETSGDFVSRFLPRSKKVSEVSLDIDTGASVRAQLRISRCRSASSLPSSGSSFAAVSVLCSPRPETASLTSLSSLLPMPGPSNRTPCHVVGSRSLFLYLRLMSGHVDLNSGTRSLHRRRTPTSIKSASSSRSSSWAPIGATPIAALRTLATDSQLFSGTLSSISSPGLVPCPSAPCMATSMDMDGPGTSAGSTEESIENLGKGSTALGSSRILFARRCPGSTRSSSPATCAHASRSPTATSVSASSSSMSG